MIEHHVEFDLPGILLPETDGRKVSTRIPARLTRIPKYAYALHYFDIETVVVNKEKLRGKEKNKSPRIVFGKVYTMENLRMLSPQGNYRILISNIEQYETKQAILCIADNWQPRLKTDIVLESHKALETLVTPI